MPITYNGIGTHYYGKRNLDSRVHNCQQCGHHATLSSYDTRLWFVVFFLPVIPLARKRIIDDCASCRRHYAVDLAKWHTMSQLEISGADEQYRATPTAEKAIALHQQLTAFHQNARAEQFRAEMAAKYNDNATVHAYLGSALDCQGRQAEALTHFTRALELRPDLPEARVGVALDHIRHERLTEADRLLEFLDKPGSGQLYSLVPLEVLANAFDRNQRPADALRCFERILSELPAAAKNAAFRKKIARLEKAVGRTETKVPKTKFSWREAFTIRNGDTGEPMISRAGLLGFGALAALVVGVLIASNYFSSKHRKVFVVNGYQDRLRFRVDGGSPTTLGAGSYQEVSVPEGAHSIRVEGSHPETIKFNVDGSFFSRWSGHPLWVVNPGGAAVLQYDTVTYSREELPPSMSLLFGQSFQKIENVTHPSSRCQKASPSRATANRRS
jgi:tetratricopeptide (TPR) repeat protein